MKRFLDATLTLIRIVTGAMYRFYWDDCFSRASSLAYTTLFALVPVSALGFSMFGVFGLEQVQLADTLHTILSQVLPPIENEQLQTLQDQVFLYLQTFSDNVRALNVISIAVLAFTGVALLNTIESALNVVWRVSANMNVISKITNFWAVITLGPLLFAWSLYWWGKAQVLATQGQSSQIFFVVMTFVVPVASTWLALTLMFYKLPAAKVRLQDAALGALFSSCLFEGVKRLFAYYVGLSTTYSTIYGVLATVPLFLFWLYLTWVVILLGAEISYLAGSIHVLRGLRNYTTDLGEVGSVLGLRITYEIAKSFIAGDQPPSESAIAIRTGADPVRVRTCLDILAKSNIITVADPNSHTRALVISPEKLRIRDILDSFRRREREGEQPLVQQPRTGEETFLELLRQASRRLPAERAIDDWTLSELIRVAANGRVED